MSIYKELQRTHACTSSDIAVGFAKNILVVGHIIFIVGIILTFLCWEQLSLAPLSIGTIIFVFSYMKSLNLLLKIKQLDIEVLTYLTLENIELKFTEKKDV